MKFSIRLLVNKKQANGVFRIVVKINHKSPGVKNTTIQKIIGHSKLKDFDQENEFLKKSHPDYEFLAPKILNLKLRAKKLQYRSFASGKDFLNELFSAEVDTVTFNEAATAIITDMKNLAAQFGRNGDLKSQNKLLGNIKVYENVKSQFELFSQNITLVGLDYNLLLRFRNYQTGIGNSKSTIHNYLRTIRAIYKKAALLYKIPASNPFEGIFAGLAQKSYNSKKKNISKDAIILLENANVTPTQKKYLDMWLLQFYFGGCDLIDVYYLYKKNIRRNRVFFERTKTNTGLPIDLKIHPKAKTIIDRYQCQTSEWLFAYGKTKATYESYRSAYAKALKAIQEKLEIEVLPNGGAIGVKVARHTFASLGKNLMIHEDILRELMGHERNDVDNFYKEKYPEAIRDEALYKIIG
jgi:hypothetical protein